MRYLFLWFIACSFAINAQDTPLSGFGANGKVIDSITGAFYTGPRDLEVYNNNIYALAYSGSSTVGVFAYDQFGESLSSFGDGGRKELTGVNGSSYSKMAMAANGDIFIVACSMSVTSVVKLDINGELVSSFGSNGRMTINFGNQVADAVVQGGTLVIGVSNYNSIAVYHVNTSSGNLDTSFDGDGQAILSFVNDSPYMYGMNQDASGNVYLFGYIYYFGGTQTGVVAKFTSAGVDSSFGNYGIADAPAGITEFQAGAVSGSTIYATGGYQEGYLVAFNTNGSVQTGFGTNGAVIVGASTSTLNESFHSILITEKGNILIAGGQTKTVAPYDADAMYYLFTSSGSTESGFGNNGVLIDSTSVSEAVYALSAFNGYDVVALGTLGSKFFVTYFYEEGATPDFPSGFSPNEDGLNDYLAIRNIHAAGQNRLVVYDREGNMVYDTEDYKNDWKGLNNNKNPLSDGVYYYVFTYSNEKKIKNFLEIRR